VTRSPAHKASNQPSSVAIVARMPWTKKTPAFGEGFVGLKAAGFPAALLA
jgi:hypothetical protein